jgi:hypothetical protein
MGAFPAMFGSKKMMRDGAKAPGVGEALNRSSNHRFRLNLAGAFLTVLRRDQ